jgi:hypothetical protein
MRSGVYLHAVLPSALCGVEWGEATRPGKMNRKLGGPQSRSVLSGEEKKSRILLELNLKERKTKGQKE